MSLIPLIKWAELHGKTRTNAARKARAGGYKTAVKMGRDWFIEEDEPDVNNRWPKNDEETKEE